MSESPVPVYGAPAPEPAPLTLAVSCRQCGTEPGPAQWTGPGLSCLCGAARHICQPRRHKYSHDTQGQGTGTGPGSTQSFPWCRLWLFPRPGRGSPSGPCASLYHLIC